MTWFTGVEEATYSIVEYIPTLGTIYSGLRASVANREGDSKRVWQSVANYLESSIRDVLIVAEVTEPVPAVLLHTMAESFTDKVIEIYHDNKTPVPKIETSKKLDKTKEHVLIAAKSEEAGETLKNQFFKGKAKGMLQFHGAAFTGTLKHPKYAREGEEVRLDLPQGFSDGAHVTFSWKWTVDASEPEQQENRPEATWGVIQLEEGTDTTFTQFRLSNRKGAGDWAGYGFWGTIKSKNIIDAKILGLDGEDYQIEFKRVN